MAESTSKLRAQVAALTNVDGKGGFDIMADNDTFKNTYDIMLGISKVWGQMTDVKQSALLELLAGKVRSNQVAALLNNMERAQEVLKTSENSEGTMAEVHARWLDSIAAKQAQLTASWENLSQTVVNSELVKSGYDFASNMLNQLDQFISKIGSLPPLLAALAPTLLGKIGGQNGATGLLGLIPAFSAKQSGVVQGDLIDAYNTAYGQTFDKTKAMDMAVQQTGQKMSDATRYAINYSNGLVQVADGSTIAGMKLKAFGGVLKTIGASLGSMAIMFAVSEAIKLLSDAVDRQVNSEKYAVEAADDAVAKHEDAKKQVESLTEQIEQLDAQYQALADKGPLSFADEQTKNDLKEQTEELRMQLEIAERLEETTGRAAFNAQKDAWREQYSPPKDFGTEFLGAEPNTIGNWVTSFRKYGNGSIPRLSSIADPAIRNAYTTMQNALYDVVGMEGIIDDAIKNGTITNDIAGSLEAIQYLADLETRAQDGLKYFKGIVANNTGIDEGTTIDGLDKTYGAVIGEYESLIVQIQSASGKLSTELTSAWKELNASIEQFEKYGETDSPLYANLKSLRDSIGQSLFPNLQSQQVILELKRTDKVFAATYDELAKMAETAELTADVLNDTKYDGFRTQLKEAGVEIQDFINNLNALSEKRAPDLSTTTTSGISTAVGNLLTAQSTGASILKNTGYGANAISEEDYKKLVKLNNPAYLDAVEYSHGGAFFNVVKFNEVLFADMAKQHNKMYDDMMAKQSEYVKQSRKLSEQIMEYNVAKKQGEDVRQLESDIASTVKTLDTLRGEIETYNRLEMQIKVATSAYTKWRLAHEAPQEGDDYDRALEAYASLKSGYQSGRVGNADYIAAQEYLLGPNGSFADAKQRKLLERYLTKSAPGSNEDTGYGARQFQQDAIKAGILDKNGQFTKAWSPEEIAEKMGIGKDLVTQLFGELNEFIPDEGKKYKLTPSTLSETARAEDYAEYIRLREGYEKAVAAYNAEASAENLQALIKAQALLTDKGGALGIDTTNESTENLTSATDKNTAALDRLTAAIALINKNGQWSIAEKDGRYLLQDANGNTLAGGAEGGNAESDYKAIMDYIAQQGGIISNLNAIIPQLNEYAKSRGIDREMSLGEDGKILVSGLGEFDDVISATLAMFGNEAQKSIEMLQAMNSLALTLGIGKQGAYDVEKNQWYIDGQEERYDSFAGLAGAMFGDYAANQQAVMTSLTSAITELTGKKFEIDWSNAKIKIDNEDLDFDVGMAKLLGDSGAEFGKKAIDAWNAELKAQGKALFGMNEDGTITVGEGEQARTFDHLIDALAYAFNGLEKSTQQSEQMITRTMQAVGMKGYAKYDADQGRYNTYDENGNFLNGYVDPISAMSEIAADPINALQTALAGINEYLTLAKTGLVATIEDGKAQITETATGEVRNYETIAGMVSGEMSTALSKTQALTDGINTINNQYAAAGSKAIIVNEALSTLNGVISSGATNIGESLDKVNAVLAKFGSEEFLGIDENGKITFGEKIFNTIDEAIAEVMSSLKLSPKKSAEMLNDMAKTLGTGASYAYDAKNGVYTKTDASGATTQFADSAEAMSEMLNAPLTQIAQIVTTINDAYATAGEDIRLSLAHGEAKLVDANGAIVKTYDSINAGLEASAQSAFDSLSEVAASLKAVEVKITADGKFTLVDGNGKPITNENGEPVSYENFVGALTQAVETNFGDINNQLATLSGAIDLLNGNGGGVVNTLIEQAADKDAEAFGRNETAVDSATKALNSFSAALAAVSLNNMLTQAGKGGRFAANDKNELVYYDDTGTEQARFSELSEVYKHIFPEYGETKLRVDENGNVTAYNQAKVDSAVKGLSGELTQELGQITSAAIGKDGLLTLNDTVQVKNAQFGTDNGQLVVEAGGAKLTLGSPSTTVVSDGVTEFRDQGGNTLLKTAGEYAWDSTAGTYVRKPNLDSEATGRILNSIKNGTATDEDVQAISNLMNYVGIMGDAASDATKGLAKQVRETVDSDATGDLFSNLVGELGDNARGWGLTRSAYNARIAEEDAKKAEELAAQAEAFKNSDLYTIAKGTNLNDPGSINDAVTAIKQIYDLDTLMANGKYKDYASFIRAIQEGRDQIYNLDDYRRKDARSYEEVMNDPTLGLSSRGDQTPSPIVDYESYLNSREYLSALDVVDKYRGTMPWGHTAEEYLSGLPEADRAELENAMAIVYRGSSEDIFNNYDPSEMAEDFEWFTNSVLEQTGLNAMSESLGSLVESLTDSASEWNPTPEPEESRGAKWDQILKREEQIEAKRKADYDNNHGLGAARSLWNQNPEPSTESRGAKWDQIYGREEQIEAKRKTDAIRNSDIYKIVSGDIEDIVGMTRELYRHYDIEGLEAESGLDRSQIIQKIREGNDEDLILMAEKYHRSAEEIEQNSSKYGMSFYNPTPNPSGALITPVVDFVEGVPNAVNGFLDSVPGAVDTAKEKMANLATTIWKDWLYGDDLVGMLSGAWKTTKPILGTILQGLTSDVQEIPPIGNEIGQLPNIVAQLWDDMWAGVHKALYGPTEKPEPPKQEIKPYTQRSIVDIWGPVREKPTNYNGVNLQRQAAESRNGAAMSPLEELMSMYDFDAYRASNRYFGSLDDFDVAQSMYLRANSGESLDEFLKTNTGKTAEIEIKANTAQAQEDINQLDGQSGTYTINIQYNDPGAPTGEGNASGTDNASAGMSLVDEEGAELIEHVNRGTYELGTNNGPRFTKLEKGDIVHNAEETKKIKRRGLLGRVADAFRNGGVKRGSAFRQAEYSDVGGVSLPRKNDEYELGTGALAQKPQVGRTGGKGKGDGGIKEALKWAEKWVDWIPTALAILKKKTQDYIKAVEKQIGYIAKNKTLDKAIQNVTDEINLNQKAVERYKKQASDFAQRAGLSSDIVKKIQEGEINIEEYDENTRKAIKTYQTWWDKAKGCLDTIESLNDQLYTLSKQKLDNIVTYFDNITKNLDAKIENYNGKVSLKEALGEELTRGDYAEAIKLTRESIKTLTEEQQALTKELDDQVARGIIKVGSDDWYTYATQIEQLTSTIQEAQISLQDLQDEVDNIALNNLQTSIYYLDNLSSRIQQLQKLQEAQGHATDVKSYRALISTGMAQIENLEAQNHELEKQMEGLDVLSEKYQELYQQLQENEETILDIKTQQEEWNDAILDLKIEMLQKQNDKYQQQLGLMQALNDLEDARQRRVLMYDNEQGFNYVADQDAIDQAQEGVNQQVFDLIIQGLEDAKQDSDIYDSMGQLLQPVEDVLSGIDFSAYYDTIYAGMETSSTLAALLHNIDMQSLLAESQGGGDISIDIGDIVLQGVSDAQSLGDAIIAQLPGYLQQALYGKNP